MSNQGGCVFDTNSLISALLIKTSISRAAFDKAINNYKLLISDETIAEFDDVVGREKFKKYITPKERAQFEELLYQQAQLVEITQTVAACRDPDDDKFLELALSAGVALIISGDKDLLTLSPFRGIDIVRPRTFVEAFPPAK